MNRKIIGLTIILLLATLVLSANMANPYSAHSITAQLVPSSKAKVLRERIDIQLVQDTLDYDYQSQFNIEYIIHAEENMDFPLVFLALNLDRLERVNVNQKEVKSIPLDQRKPQFSFLRVNNGYYEINYGKEEWERIELSDGFYFTAKLHKGENSIKVQYRAFMGYDRRDIIRKYKIEYFLFPSKYWSSFGPIDLYLHRGNKIKVYTANLGAAQQQTDSLIHWKIESVEKKESFTIEVGEKSPLLANIILWIHPELLALIGFIVLCCLHIRYIYKKHKIGGYRYALLIGNLIVPASFNILCWFWTSVANYLVNGIFDHNARGFILLFIVSMPLYYIVYDLVLLVIDRSIRIKFQKQQSN
ncbi:hypothetical protein ACK8HY_16155 [Sphingobacterium sp. NGMCC 1.201703]|uniref:hypothetical protein n=1 Tax=Sphingobacterium sp. NGMCC 1.201703 TaxID=3388657 RepID=UPI0039FC2048